MGGYTKTAKWLIIRHLKSKGKHHLEIRDSIRRKKRGKGNEIIAFIENAIKPFTFHSGLYPRTLPLFIEANNEKEHTLLLKTLSTLPMEASLLNRLGPAILSAAKWNNRSKLKLPLGLLVFAEANQWLDLLNEKEWFQRLRVSIRVISLHCRRRGAEGKFHALSKNAANRGLCPRRNDDLIFCRHRHPIN